MGKTEVPRGSLFLRALETYFQGNGESKPSIEKMLSK